jgi:hypothetical protein
MTRTWKAFSVSSLNVFFHRLRSEFRKPHHGRLLENCPVRGSDGFIESFYAYLEKTRDRTVDEPGNGPFFFMTSLHPLIAFSPPILASLKSNKAIKASRAVITLAAARVRCLGNFVPPTVLYGIVSVAVLERDAVVTLAIVIIGYFDTHGCSALAGCRYGFVKGINVPHGRLQDQSRRQKSCACR